MYVYKGNLCSWAQERCQTLRIKVCFVRVLFSCFLRKVWICKNNSKRCYWILHANSEFFGGLWWCFLTPTGSTVLWRMLCPLVTWLYLLCLNISICVVLITLNISLSGKMLHVNTWITSNGFLSLFLSSFYYRYLCKERQSTECRPVWCLQFQRF